MHPYPWSVDFEMEIETEQTSERRAAKLLLQLAKQGLRRHQGWKWMPPVTISAPTEEFFSIFRVGSLEQMMAIETALHLFLIRSECTGESCATVLSKIRPFLVLIPCKKALVHRAESAKHELVRMLRCRWKKRCRWIQNCGPSMGKKGSKDRSKRQAIREIFLQLTTHSLPVTL